jgi:alpha-beta hydrolase superfamily lysophospholipase
MVLAGNKKVYILKLVLLPGMDGTGELFEEFLSYHDGEHLVISLPQKGPQDYSSLAKSLEKQLPKEDYILLAESFSGGIVPELLKQDLTNMKGVIFVASFLSCPNRYLLPIAKILPIKVLASAPLSKIGHKFLLLGQDASKALLSKFIKVAKSIPDHILKSRLAVMSQQELPLATFDVPTVYIQALSDRLISPRKSRELSNVFRNIEYIEIDGPHFLLQAKPKESSQAVAKATVLIMNHQGNS